MSTYNSYWFITILLGIISGDVPPISYTFFLWLVCPLAIFAVTIVGARAMRGGRPAPIHLLDFSPVLKILGMLLVGDTIVHSRYTQESTLQP